MIDMPALIQECAPSVPNVLMQSLVRKESAFNPYAIGMDSKQGAVKQPSNLQDAINTVNQLKKEGRTFSIGLAQIHIANVEKLNLTLEQAFEPCVNLHAGELILWSFYKKAVKYGYQDSSALWAMLRGYNSGDINGAVSNQYASDILRNANMSSAATSIQMNYKITQSKDQIVKENENEKDFFGNNEADSQDIFEHNAEKSQQ